MPNLVRKQACKDVGDDETSQRLFEILRSLDRMQSEDGYHTDTASRAPRPQLRRWLLLIPAILAVAYAAYAF